jgi:hypothetical protein
MSPGTDLVVVAGIEASPEVAEFLPDNLPELVGDLESEIARSRANAKSIEIVDDESCATAENVLKEIVGQRKALKAERVSLTKPRKDAAEAVKGRYDEIDASFKEAEEELRKTVGDWRAEKEKARREEQERLERERAERERMQREAREREEAAARERAEKAAREAREAAELAAEDGDDEMQALADEAVIEAQEAATAADAIAALPVIDLPTPVVPVAETAGGISGRTKREAFVVDRSLLPENLPDGTPLIVIDMVALRRWMNEQWTATGEPPVLAGAKFERVPDGLAVRS